MAFKEYQHREINPKSFPKRTSSLPANDMIIVPYNYRPNSRLRHATNSSFMDSMKGMELVRSQSFSAYSCPDDLKNVKDKTKETETNTESIDESAEDFVHDLSSNGSPNHVAKRDCQSDYDDDDGRKSVQNTFLKKSRFKCNEKLKTKQDQNKFNHKPAKKKSCCCLLKSVLNFSLFLITSFMLAGSVTHLYISPVPSPKCTFNQSEILSKLRAGETKTKIESVVFGQSELIGNIVAALADFLEAMEPNITTVFIYGPTGVGKTLTVQTVLKAIEVPPQCVSTLDYLSNLTLPLYGLKIFHMDAANMFPDDSMMITSAPSIPDVLVPYQFFLPKSISYYFSRKTIIFVTSNYAPEKGRDSLWRNLQSSAGSVHLFEARYLNREDVKKCVDLELNQKPSLNIKREIVEFVLQNIEFNSEGQSLPGCKTVRKLINVFLNE